MPRKKRDRRYMLQETIDCVEFLLKRGTPKRRIAYALKISPTMVYRLEAVHGADWGINNNKEPRSE